MFCLPCVSPKGALLSHAFSGPSFHRRTDRHIPANHFNQILITLFSQITQFNDRPDLKRHFPGSSVMFILLFFLQIHNLMPYQSACLWPSQTIYLTLRNALNPSGNNQKFHTANNSTSTYLPYSKHFPIIIRNVIFSYISYIYRPPRHRFFLVSLCL
jgi:hypothetical protein